MIPVGIRKLDQSNFELILEEHAKYLRSGLDDYRADLSGFDMSDLKMHGRNMKLVRLRNSVFNSTKFEMSQYTNCDFRGSTFKNCNLSTTIFINCCFDCCRFVNCDAEKSTFQKCSFNNTLMQENDFRETNFNDSSFKQARIDDCDLRLADLSGTYWDEINTIIRSKLIKVTITGIKGINHIALIDDRIMNEHKVCSGRKYFWYIDKKEYIKYNIRCMFDSIFRDDRRYAANGFRNS